MSNFEPASTDRRRENYEMKLRGIEQRFDSSALKQRQLVWTNFRQG